MSGNITYTIQLRPEPEGGFTVLVPALPEVISYGASEGEALRMAEDAIATSKERNGGQMTAAELDEKYNRDLKGEPLDPNTLVDPKTLVPAPAE